MFNSLTGTITGKYPQHLYLDTNGIEWDLLVSESTLDSLPTVGETAKVYVWMQHTDQLMNLYGFASLDDRSLFFDLLKVDGIGPKAALKILGSIDVPSFVQILDSGDVDALQKVPGIGKKTAGKVLLQLKGKLSLQETVAVPKAAVLPFAAVTEALVSMGHDKRQAELVVSQIMESLKSDAEFASLSESEREDTVFRKAIVELAR